MFSWSEIVLIAVVALIFIGPKELPAALHMLGQAAGKLRRSAEEFRRHFEESMREAGYDDLHKNINDLRSLNPSSQLRSAIDSAINQNYAPRPQPTGAQPSPPPFAGTPPVPPNVTPAVEAGAPAAAAFEFDSQGDKAGEIAASAAAARGAQETAAGPSKDHAATVA